VRQLHGRRGLVDFLAAGPGAFEVRLVGCRGVEFGPWRERGFFGVRGRRVEGVGEGWEVESDGLAAVEMVGWEAREVVRSAHCGLRGAGDRLRHC